MKSAKSKVQQFFSYADIKINGNRPWDIQVHDERFYDKMLADAQLGFGESYMNNWWDCAQLDECIFKIYRAQLEKKVRGKWRYLFPFLISKITNMQDKMKSKRDVGSHYNIGNDLYQSMLDKRMVYTCGYWKNAKNLNEAQEAKLDLVCKKIGLKSGMTVLDIGCGWGSFAKFAAEKYKVKVVGITISNEQIRLARKLCKGLPIEIRFQDYRDVNEKFDRIVSLGMFEHVGPKNHRKFMEVAHRCLKDDGVFLLHTLGSNVSNTRSSPWSNKYIFPGAVTPSIKQIGKSMEGLFVMEDWHNFGQDYAKTTMAWWSNFDKNYKNLKQKYNERFYKMWKFYLQGGSGIMRAREGQLWQIVLTKEGIVGGYNPIS
ncbi:cyclopropane fatty acyl phospholipid synthase [Candidatus Pacearchaeota archaeon]|nr:cyclopropane fatty acyl phospholipid synthase [Candidatus Pacearchaeota archaeon]